MKNNTLYIGYGRENISPRYPDGSFIPVRTAGYPQIRVCDKILTELYASCTAFRGADGNTVLLYSIDNIGIPTEDIDYICRMINEATGVPNENIALNVSHSHTAPGLGYTDTEEIRYYRNNIFFGALVRAANAAIADLALCTDIYVGCADGKGYTFIRRYDTDAEGNLHPETEADTDMPIARFVREGKRDVIFANWAAHSDTVGLTNKDNFCSVASDYIGAFRDTVEKKLNAHFSMLMGANGDVSPLSEIKGEYDFPGTDLYGEALAGKLIEAMPTLRRIEPVGTVKMISTSDRFEVNHTLDHLAEAAEEIYVRYQKDKKDPELPELCRKIGIGKISLFHGVLEASAIVTRARAPKDVEMKMWAMRIGEIGFAMVPYEMFTKTGVDIKAASPFDLTFVCGLTNGNCIYIPADYCFDKHDYEVFACRHYRGTAEKIQQNVSNLMNELYKEV